MLSHPKAFDENPVIRWLPSRAVKPLDALAYVLVYVRKSGELLQSYCTEHPENARTPAMPCALAGARAVYNNMT